jgi:osmotically-inducible protein OsmY
MLIVPPCVAAESSIEDDTIRSSIQRYLNAETTVSPGAVAIQVDDGIVMLSGTVSNLLQLDQAERIAESVRGVRSVVNDIRVQPIVRNNQAIAKDVHAVLARPRADALSDIAVKANGGVVTLTGTVDSWVRSRLAVRKTMTVKGVSDIVNQIEVAPQGPRDDSAIQTDITRRLAADLYVDASDIEVTVQDGRVILKGSVQTAAERRRAVEDAWISGVEAVQDRGLVVRRPQAARMKRPSSYIRQSDRAILQAVEDALHMDPRVNAANPEVTVANGVVTLSGAVDTLYAKWAAEADALNTTGVWKVDNQLQFRYRSFPSDEEVERMIRDVLARDTELHDQRIQLTVDDNHVYLSGWVESAGQRVRAENVVAQVEGVLTLENRIKVFTKTDPVDDVDITAAINDELFWSPYVDSDTISVTVKDGRAALKGHVANRFVARIAVANAFEGGARRVRTILELKSGGTLAEDFREKPVTAGPGPALGLWR